MNPIVLPDLNDPIKDTLREAEKARAINRLLRPVPDLPPGEISSKSLPRTYEIVQHNNQLTPHAYRDLLPHIERMSKQGMSLKFIAARLGVALFALEEAVKLFPDVAAAITGGLARGVDEQSEAMYRRGLGEDTSAGKFFLQTRGEFNPPAQAGSTVTVNIGAQPAAVSLDDVRSMAERQRLLLEGDAEED